MILSFYNPPNAAARSDWTPDDTARQVALTALICADWMQTQEIVKDPENRAEANPILGEHPSMGRVNLLIPVSILAAFVVARVLPSPWRGWFQWGIIGVEAAAIYNNHRRGIRISF